VLERSSVLAEEDVEIRYFNDMWAFLDSGINAEIIKVEHDDDEEDTGKDFVNHGEVIVALKKVMISKNNKNSEDIVAVIDAMISRIENMKMKKERKKIRKKEREKFLREKRQTSLKKRCVRDEEFFCTVNIIKIFTSYLLVNKEPKMKIENLMKISILISISISMAV
jgi:hypothetical protein